MTVVSAREARTFTVQVLLAFVDPDFTQRLDPSALIAGLVARLATTALAQTQRAVRTQQVATLDERRRVARDLHDLVSQCLVGLQLVAQAALDAWETQPQQAHATGVLVHIVTGPYSSAYDDRGHGGRSGLAVRDEGVGGTSRGRCRL